MYPEEKENAFSDYDMTQTSSTTLSLSPSYKLSISIIIIAMPLLLVNLWVGVPVALIGLFLLYQTPMIKLVFTPTALEVKRQEKLLKTFPYAEWESWKIFWQPVPILFYFKEINSIHFVPVLYDPEELRAQLEKYCPDCAV
ncbi:MAG: DUF3119 family protein [Cyanobacteria bacterium J06627_28]